MDLFFRLGFILFSCPLRLVSAFRGLSGVRLWLRVKRSRVLG